MSVESRSPLRVLRRKKEDERPDYSEPDFSGWSAKLDDFIPAAKGTSAKVGATETAAPAPVVKAPVVVAAPAVDVVDKGPSLENVLENPPEFSTVPCVLPSSTATAG